ncbi:MAG: ZIP family metal transporter, partial [Chloroflexota bacterium]
AISSAFLASPGLGVIVFAAIMLHKLPEGFTVASVMKASGSGRRGTMGAAGILAVATFAGVVATGLVGDSLAGYSLAVATGSVLYVGATDLMSEANKEFNILNP